MKPLLLHGSAKIASRNKLLSIKEKFEQNDIVIFEEGTDLKVVLDNISSQYLFSEERLVILENPVEDFINYALQPIPCTLIIWFDHEVSSKKPILDWAKKNGEVFLFPEAKEISVFPLLDYLANKDIKAFLELQKLKNAGFDIQYFITMVFYLLRNLAVTPKSAPQFVKDKLIRQRKNLSPEKVKNLYKEILEIDFKIKKGLFEKSHAEFLLIDLFCH